MVSFTTALIAVLAAATTSVSANDLNFVNQDSTTRTIYFKNNPGFWAPDPIVCPGSQTTVVTMPAGWQGMFYSVNEGLADPGKGMLGEVTYDTTMNLVFFDVSAIDAPNDTEGVKLMYPKNSGSTPFSGCQDQKFPCDNVYNNWDDVQTKASTDLDLVVLIGNKAGLKKRGGPSERREAAKSDQFENFGRDVLSASHASEEEA